MSHNNEALQQDYYHITADCEDLYYEFKDWALSFLNCKKMWEEEAQCLADKVGATGFFIKNFDVPRFHFETKPDLKWNRHKSMKGLYVASPMVDSYDYQRFVRLQKPENFNVVCHKLGLPVLPMDYSYKLTFTYKVKLVLNIPKMELIPGVFDESQLAILNGLQKISSTRVKYWFAKEKMELEGEELD